MLTSAPAEHDLLLLGGGHSHLAVLRRLSMHPLPGLRVTLVARELHTPYSGMLPGLIAGHYDFEAAHVDLTQLAAAAGARLLHGEVEDIDAGKRLLRVPGRPPLRYDTLSINSGATPDLARVVGKLDRLLPVKPISRLLPRLETVYEHLRLAGQSMTMVIVGGGPGGVELALALDRRLRQEDLRGRVVLRLLTAGERLLGEHGQRVARTLSKELAAAGIEVSLGAQVEAVGDDALDLAGGARIPADVVLWATGASAPAWLQGSGLQLDRQGFLAVGASLQSLSHPEVFAAGDVAALTHAPRPKSGVYAVRAGPVLAHNLLAWIRGRPLRAFRPQRHALSLISTGDRRAVVSRPGWPAWRGSVIWHWKDWIDRRFMARYTGLRPMVAQPPRSVVAAERGGQRLAAGMRCRGCGGKLAAAPLAQALAGIDAATPFEDAAALWVDDTLLQQTIDGFALPVSDPYLGGRLAALHALGDLHAMGARPVAALALAGIPYAASVLMQDDLVQVMAGARRELEAAGAKLLGGHSCESDSLTLGLALTGRMSGEASVLGKDRLQPGQALILTKPLGTGTLLAGAAAGRVPAWQQQQVWEAMLQSNGPAVAILRRHGATACTDVTGFGLLGHAWEMATASNCALEIDVDQVGSLSGALTAIEAGMVSSLQDANEEVLLQAELGPGLRPGAAVLRLLCDPQTCGGLLFSLPASAATACVDALIESGFTSAAVVGRVLAREADQLSLRLIRSDRGTVGAP